jgi:hypothetical protein
MKMPTIESVQAIVSNRVLTMTDSKGAPVRSYGGDKYKQKVAEGDNVTLIAQRLTMKIHLSRSGNDMAGFNRPMNLNNFTSW